MPRDMSAPPGGIRFRPGAVAAGLCALAMLPVPSLARRYGPTSAARFATATSAAILLQQALVGLAARRHAGASRAARLGPVDVVTCGRGATAAVLAGLVASGVRDRSGPAGWTGWVSLCGGSVLLDWLDGPIARRLGTSPAGAVYDLEADSWLTLSSAAAAAAWGGVPGWCLAAPALRYVLLARALRYLRYADVFASEPPWARWTGIGQMLLFTAALAPFGGRATRGAVRLAAPVVAPLQVAVMLALHRRLGLGRAGR
jgi:phosphatidylglycerophosphate synthase